MTILHAVQQATPTMTAGWVGGSQIRYFLGHPLCSMENCLLSGPCFSIARAGPRLIPRCWFRSSASAESFESRCDFPGLVPSNRNLIQKQDQKNTLQILIQTINRYQRISTTDLTVWLLKGCKKFDPPMPGNAHPKAVQVLLLSMLPMQHAAADLRPDVIFRAAILKIPRWLVWLDGSP